MKCSILHLKVSSYVQTKDRILKNQMFYLEVNPEFFSKDFTLTSDFRASLQLSSVLIGGGENVRNVRGFHFKLGYI